MSSVPGREKHKQALNKTAVKKKKKTGRSKKSLFFSFVVYLSVIFMAQVHAENHAALSPPV